MDSSRMDGRTFLCLSMLVCVVLAFRGVSDASEIREYCERETFRATCNEDEVILMTSAQYGRMKRGRCVKTNYGSLGCSDDVLPLVHSYCSGRRQCEFPISGLHSTSQCPMELLSYLEASYDCIQVASCSASLCKAGSYLRLPTTRSGYIGGITTTETGCGLPECPWMLEPEEGQRVNLTFFSFQGPSSGAGQNHCQRKALVLDKKTQVSKDVTVCSGGDRTFSMTTSPSAAAEIKVYSGGQETASHILIHYKVIGCPTIKPPAGATAERSGNTLTVTCAKTPSKWHLTCDGNAWVGEVGVCDEPVNSAPWTENGGGTSPQGLAMVVGIGVALGVLLGFTLLGLAVFCMRRHRRNHYQRPDDIIRYPQEVDKSYDIKIYDQGTPNKTIPTPDSGYYTGTNYQTRPPSSLGTGNVRQMTSPRTLQSPPHGGALQTYFQSMGPMEGPCKFRDHVYESPHFKQEDANSVATAAST